MKISSIFALLCNKQQIETAGLSIITSARSGTRRFGSYVLPAGCVCQ